MNSTEQKAIHEEPQGEEPQGTPIFAREAWELLGITREAFYRQVSRGTFQAYFWGDNFTKLYPQNPEDRNKQNFKVFYKEHILEHMAKHPLIGEGDEYTFTHEDREAVIETVQAQMEAQGYVELRKLRLLMTHRNKSNAIALPAILAIIDEHGWPLEEHEQADIDALLAKGRSLLAQYGYVSRTQLWQYMRGEHHKNTLFYPVIGYIAEREHWPLEPGQEGYAQKRREGSIQRRKPRRSKKTE